jgi:hypothetical protein
MAHARAGVPVPVAELVPQRDSGLDDLGLGGSAPRIVKPADRCWPIAIFQAGLTVAERTGLEPAD